MTVCEFGSSRAPFDYRESRSFYEKQTGCVEPEARFQRRGVIPSGATLQAEEGSRADPILSASLSNQRFDNGIVKFRTDLLDCLIRTVRPGAIRQ